MKITLFKSRIGPFEWFRADCATDVKSFKETSLGLMLVCVSLAKDESLLGECDSWGHSHSCCSNQSKAKRAAAQISMKEVTISTRIGILVEVQVRHSQVSPVISLLANDKGCKPYSHFFQMSYKKKSLHSTKTLAMID